MTSIRAIICCAIVAVVFTGCGIQIRPRGTSYERTDFKLEVRSNTTWTAATNDGRAIDGEFNETIDLPDGNPPVCAVVSKTSVDGWVRARVTPGGSWNETNAPDGSVTPCNNI